MEWLTNIINNAWVISIVTGVIVYIATNWFSKFKDNKEYRKNINQVTDDIVVMLQEFIVENQLPEKDVLFSYYTATCEKYNVLPKDTKSIAEILDFLTKEILDSQFLNGTNKLEYCNLIEKYKLGLKFDAAESVSELITKQLKEEEERYNKIRNQMPFMIGLSASVITLITTFYAASDSIAIVSKNGTLISVITIILIFTVLLLVYLSERITNKRK